MLQFKPSKQHQELKTGWQSECIIQVACCGCALHVCGLEGWQSYLTGPPLCTSNLKGTIWLVTQEWVLPQMWRNFFEISLLQCTSLTSRVFSRDVVLGEKMWKYPKNKWNLLLFGGENPPPPKGPEKNTAHLSNCSVTLYTFYHAIYFQHSFFPHLTAKWNTSPSALTSAPISFCFQKFIF